MRLFRKGASDMTDGVIWKHLLHFALPMLIGLIFQQLYNTVDAVVVGQFVGKEALAAVGNVGPIMNMLVGLAAGLSTGASVIISQRYGAHDNKKLHDAVHTTMGITLVMCVLITIFGVLIVDPMLAFMNVPSDVYAQAKTYLQIYFLGVTGLLVYNMGSGILRAVGDSKRPLYFLCTSAVLNTIFDLIFVVNFKMGVAGVGYATILAQFISACLVLYSLTHDNAPYGLRLKDICIKKEDLRGILAIGMPSGIQQAITSFSNVFVQSYINYFGSACMAGWSTFSKVDAFVTLPLQSIALASTTFVGQNYGAKNLKRAKKGVSTALYMSLSITTVLVILVVLFVERLVVLFNADPDVVYYGRFFILWATPFHIVLCFNQIYAGALRGIGIAKAPMMIMLLSFVVFRQVYLYVTKLLFPGSILAVTLGYPLGWLLCSVLISIYYLRSPLGSKKYNTL